MPLVKIFSDNRGYVLLTTYMLMAAISVTAMANMTRTFVYTRDAERQSHVALVHM